MFEWNLGVNWQWGNNRYETIFFLFKKTKTQEIFWEDYAGWDEQEIWGCKMLIAK